MGESKSVAGYTPGEAPRASLTLEYVHGYAAQKSRNNLFFTHTEYKEEGGKKIGVGRKCIVYHVAAVGVILDPQKNTQRHAFHHTDDILCLTKCPEPLKLDGKYTDVFASGEIGKRPKICVWKSNKNVELIVSIRGFHKRGVNLLSFSGGRSEYLASIGLDDDHSVAVYDWKKNELKYNARTNKSCVPCRIAI